ncbi:MAG: SDR family oxidoreductase [Thermoanaerobaculia bacterium]|nr:SDR family oxidoreductase [Thermoanaerobaculia bacterium]
MKVLIAGCGDLGTALGLDLAAKGDEVYGLRRNPERLPAAIRPLAADLADPTTLAALPEVDAIVYAAAAGRSTDEAYRRAYVDGVRHLLAASAIQRHPPQRFLFVSSTAVYAQDAGEWIDESSPTSATDFRGGRLLEAEEVVRSGAPPGTRTTVLRLAGIYGPGRTRLIDLVRSGRATDPPGLPRYANRIHRDDAAGALAHLLRLSRPAPLYLGVDDAPVDLADVLTFLAIELGVPARQSAETTTPGGIERSSKRCSNALLKASGYRFRYPTYREGYGELLRQLAG